MRGTQFSDCLKDKKTESVGLKKPVEKHEGEVLQQKRSKSLGHILHRVDQILQIAVKSLSSWWWVYKNVFSVLLLKRLVVFAHLLMFPRHVWQMIDNRNRNCRKLILGTPEINGVQDVQASQFQSDSTR